jgi:hypothetical protein
MKQSKESHLSNSYKNKKCFNNLNVIIISIITPMIRIIPINNMFYKIFVALDLFSIFIKDSNLQYKRFQGFYKYLMK